MAELKIGDKLILTYIGWNGTNHSIKSITKINKESYKLNNGVLITKDLKTKAKQERFSTTSETYELYTVERWNKLKEIAKEKEYSRWLNKLLKEKDLNIEFMKRYIKECDIYDGVQTEETKKNVD